MSVQNILKGNAIYIYIFLQVLLQNITDMWLVSFDHKINKYFDNYFVISDTSIL